MLQIAVFVDAGYLYAQGSALLRGQRQKRSDIRLKVEEVTAALKRAAAAVAPHSRLLRVYWYDGMQRGGRLSEEQAAIARAHDLKLRLGMINSHGEQKGVDSLIVTDLIELARNQAIGDALILSGDEDIRVGVQVAQTFGVRIHLLGIEPARGSQSPDLLQEADTCLEWTRADVDDWMDCDVAPSPASDAPILAPHGEAPPDPAAATFDGYIAIVVAAALEPLPSTDVRRLQAHLDANRDQIPGEVDRPALAHLNRLLDRRLSDDERRRYRQLFAAAIRTAPLTDRSDL